MDKRITFRCDANDIANIEKIKVLINSTKDSDVVRYALDTAGGMSDKPVEVPQSLLPPSREGYKYTIADIDFVCSDENNVCPKCSTEKAEIQLSACGHLKEGGPILELRYWMKQQTNE